MDIPVPIAWLLLGGLLFVAAVLLIALHIYLQRTPEYLAALALPGAPMRPLIGNIMSLLLLDAQQSFQHLRDCARDYGGRSYRFWILGRLHYNVVRAADVEALLTSSRQITKSQLYDFLRPLMGTGLLTSTGQKWHQRRRILTPTFHFNILQDFLGIFSEESAKLVSGLQLAVERGETTVLQEIIPRFTLNTICESAMGVKIDSIAEPDAYRANLIKVGQWMVFRSTTPFLHANAIYRLTGLSFLLDRYLKPVHDFSWGVIHRRRQSFQRNATGGSSTDADKSTDVDNNDNDLYMSRKRRYAMLDTLLAAEADSQQIDESGIREEVDTFMFEGYDTTSAALTFCLLMLAHHPLCQQRVLDEIEEVMRAHGDGNGGCCDVADLCVADYTAMVYVDCFVRETLRLYPPVAFFGRELTDPLLVRTEDDDGYECELMLPVGTQVHIHSFDLHRDAEQFPEPERFDPERFATAGREGRHPFAYLAFSVGPRNCIGQRFAMLEIKSLIAHILLRYRVLPVTRVEDVVFVSDIILRPKHDIRVQFIMR